MPSTESSATSHAVGLTTSPGLLPTPSFSHFINVKLGRDTYLLWKAQLMPYLRSQQLLGYVDGSIVPPPHTVVPEGETQRGANPEYTVWFQLVLSVLFSPMTEEWTVEVIPNKSMEIGATRVQLDGDLRLRPKLLQNSIQ